MLISSSCSLRFPHPLAPIPSSSPIPPNHRSKQEPAPHPRVDLYYSLLYSQISMHAFGSLSLTPSRFTDPRCQFNRGQSQNFPKSASEGDGVQQAPRVRPAAAAPSFLLFFIPHFEAAREMSRLSPSILLSYNRQHAGH